MLSDLRRSLYAISIHAPRTGSDNAAQAESRVPDNFNPRSPHGERLSALGYQRYEYGISIHAPRTGSDESAEYTIM